MTRLLSQPLARRERGAIVETGLLACMFAAFLVGICPHHDPRAYLRPVEGLVAFYNPFCATGRRTYRSVRADLTPTESRLPHLTSIHDSEQQFFAGLMPSPSVPGG